MHEALLEKCKPSDTLTSHIKFEIRAGVYGWQKPKFAVVARACYLSERWTSKTLQYVRPEGLEAAGVVEAVRPLFFQASEWCTSINSKPDPKV